jgi:hypothetical protein
LPLASGVSPVVARSVDFERRRNLPQDPRKPTFSPGSVRRLACPPFLALYLFHRRDDPPPHCRALHVGLLQHVIGPLAGFQGAILAVLADKDGGSGLFVARGFAADTREPQPLTPSRRPRG